MGLIENELQDVSKLCEHLVPGSRLISCVHSMVRVEIKRNTTKTIVVCAQFPANYPVEPLLLELKSKTLSDQLLEKLTGVCETETHKLIGKPQILPVLKFVRTFLDDNPLSCCYDEISAIKQDIESVKSEGDELRLRQKSSSLVLQVKQGLYYLRSVILVPDLYPAQPVIVQDVDSNFPPLFQRFFMGQAKEIARRKVEPPLCKSKTQKPFTPQPSLLAVARFLHKLVKDLPDQKCQLCKLACLPQNPKEAEVDENAEMHVERVYCGHLFHQTCLISYMKTPPFEGGKKCPGCGQRVYHDKWRLSEKVAEDRWAHQQARERELEEVADFLNT